MTPKSRLLSRANAHAASASRSVASSLYSTRRSAREPDVDLERLKTVRPWIFLVVVVVLPWACTTVESGNAADSAETPEMLAAALAELVTEDHTFGALIPEGCRLMSCTAPEPIYDFHGFWRLTCV